MKPFLLSFLILTAATPLVVRAEDAPKSVAEVTYKELKWEDDVYFLNGQPFTGVAKDKFKSGGQKGEYPFKEGRLHGVVREWWENGQLSTETNFDHGKRHGLNRYWSQSGQLMKEQVYDHDHSVSEKHYEVKD